MIKLFPFLFALFFVPVNLQQSDVASQTTAPRIQVALLLDTSNSMDGLINQAKAQLWKMVNELALTKKEGKSPTIEIALYEYGNDGLNAKEGYIRQVTPMTTDLDLISEQLFALTTNGGNEYCGWVIGDATEALGWSTSNQDLKLIIIAGNEPFDQGTVDFRKTCKEAIAQGIQINTIFCGDYEEGVRTHWKKGAEMADGLYFNIDANAEVVHIPTPYDDEILRLNEKLNKTYIYYGSHGSEMSARQSAQDSNAASYGKPSAASRASYKAKKQYRNESWDLVDASEDKADFVLSVPEEELPPEMRDMTAEERKAYVAEKTKEREEVRAQILELDKKARAYRAQKEREMAESGEVNTLDAVIRKALRQQAAEKGFVVEQ